MIILSTNIARRVQIRKGNAIRMVERKKVLDAIENISSQCEECIQDRETMKIALCGAERLVINKDIVEIYYAWGKEPGIIVKNKKIKKALESFFERK